MVGSRTMSRRRGMDGRRICRGRRRRGSSISAALAVGGGGVGRATHRLINLRATVNGVHEFTGLRAALQCLPLRLLLHRGPVRAHGQSAHTNPRGKRRVRDRKERDCRETGQRSDRNRRERDCRERVKRVEVAIEIEIETEVGASATRRRTRRLNGRWASGSMRRPREANTFINRLKDPTVYGGEQLIRGRVPALLLQPYPIRCCSFIAADAAF